MVGAKLLTRPDCAVGGTATSKLKVKRTVQCLTARRKNATAPVAQFGCANSFPYYLTERSVEFLETLSDYVK
jgi:hypothetical protein